MGTTASELIPVASTPLLIMLTKIVLLGLACLAALAVADKRPTNSYQPPHKEEGMPFAYNWAVDDEYTNNHFHHDTKSDGKVTEGEYRVLLPDGRTQIVKYPSDHHNGFQAEVTYEGEAKPYVAQPSYEPPKKTYA